VTKVLECVVECVKACGFAKSGRIIKNEALKVYSEWWSMSNSFYTSYYKSSAITKEEIIWKDSSKIPLYFAETVVIQ
jgi:hypothetical protein